MPVITVSRLARSVLAMLALLSISACSTIYKTTGDILISFGEDEMVPYLLQGEDDEMACAAGESLTPLLMSFDAVGTRTDKVAALVHIVAGTCDEARALEHELRSIRAIRQKNADEARDARIAQKRFSAMAARRQLQAYRFVTGHFGEPAEAGQCPKLKSDFDQLVWIMGLVAGTQAVLNDMASGGVVGVPKNIAPMVIRGAACVDNQTWWGLPQGIRAALWATLPPLNEDRVDAWAELEKSVAYGNQVGVRLGAALYVLAAHGQGNLEATRKVIRQFADDNFQVAPEWKMLDRIAVIQVQMASDRLWTEATGSRTPIGKLGTFWDDKPDTGTDIDISDLL